LRIQFWIQGFDDQKFLKFKSLKKLIFFKSKIAIYFKASIKDAQAAGEAFSPQKRTFSNSKHEMYLLFSFFVGHFCPPESGSGSASLKKRAVLGINNEVVQILRKAQTKGISAAKGLLAPSSRNLG
jgi:hypothetical protein